LQEEKQDLQAEVENLSKRENLRKQEQSSHLTSLEKDNNKLLQTIS